MICEICGKNEATIHIQEIINSKKKVLHICKACAEGKEAAKAMFSGIDLAQLLYNIGAEISGGPAGGKELQAGAMIPPLLKCPSCGWDIVRFTNIGRLGCAECFKTFRGILDQAIRNMHKGALHVGKKPGGGKGNPPEAQDKMARIMELQKRLEEQIMREEYEKAADTRDKVAALKEGVKSARTKEKKNDKRQSD